MHAWKTPLHVFPPLSAGCMARRRGGCRNRLQSSGPLCFATFARAPIAKLRMCSRASPGKGARCLIRLRAPHMQTP